ncbi:uncharacterized protein LOC134267508 [Saccostrea cucullata]|uniref:uncharacterized protein LOC134267508 n=1 Tax=Saccostrea cuccullata TaxID=36930 RepID=UPI002ED05177
MYCTVFWIKIAVLTVCLVLGQSKKHIASNICPREILTYVSEGNACNRSLEDLQSSIDYLGGENNGCNSTCTASFNYDNKDSRQYDIVEIKVTVFNNIRNISLTFDACMKVANNSGRTLSINCNEVETNAYFYHRWCRNRSDCLQNQDCLLYGDLGVCSATITNNISTVDKRNKENRADGYEIGHVIGAVIGGFVTGIGICAAVMFILRRNPKRLKDKSRDVKVQFEKKSSFEIGSGQKGDQKEPLNDEDKEYSTVTNVPKNNEDLYNHLNEVKEENNMDLYDHAHNNSTTS